MRRIIVTHKNKQLKKTIIEMYDVEDIEIMTSKFKILKEYLKIFCPYVNIEHIETSNKHLSEIMYYSHLCNVMQNLIDNELKNPHDDSDSNNITFKIRIDNFYSSDGLYLSDSDNE